MKYSFKFFIILSVPIALSFVAGTYVFAAYNIEKAKQLKYPIAELGGCKSFEECKAYCNKDENIPKCNRFSIKNDLLTPEEVADTERMLSLMEESGLPGKCEGMIACFSYCESAAHVEECWDYAQRHGLNRGLDLETVRRLAKLAREGERFPGNCQGRDECETYCSNISNFAECANFGEKAGLVSKDEADTMRKIVQSGVTETPGNCKTKESCLKYCDDSANAVVCMEFAQKAGFIPKEDAEAVSKIIPYLKSGGKLPGGCTRKESCDKYCEDDAHADECANFALNAGFISKEDAEIVKKTGGKGPGNCRSKEACDAYCKDTAHIDECVDFAVKAGFISEADAADAKKYKINSGPGNCKSKADCEAFCVLPENQDTCFKFAKDHGMISEEDLKNIEQYRKQGPPDFSQVNPEWLACMEKEMGSVTFERFKAGKSDRVDFPAVQEAQKKCQSAMGPDIRKEIESCLGKTTCAEFSTCIDALPKGNQQPPGQNKQDENGEKMQERLKSCQQELINTKVDACLAVSCSQFDACIKGLQQGGKDDRSGQKQEQGAPENPKITAKAQACQKEKIDACLSKPCGEFQSCINSLGGGDSGRGQGTPDPAVQAKFQSCQPKKSGGDKSFQPSSDKQQQQQQQQPTREEIQKQIEEQQKQTEEQIRKQYEEQNKQQYPLLPWHQPFALILNFLLGAKK